MKNQCPVWTFGWGLCGKIGFRKRQSHQNPSNIFFFSFRAASSETACNAHFRPHYRAFVKRVRALPLFRVARSVVGLVSAEIVAIHQRLWKFRRPIKTLPELPPPPTPDSDPSATLPASLGFTLFRFPLQSPRRPVRGDNNGHIVSRHKPVNQARVVVLTPLERYLLRRKINCV